MTEIEIGIFITLGARVCHRARGVRNRHAIKQRAHTGDPEITIDIGVIPIIFLRFLKKILIFLIGAPAIHVSLVAPLLKGEVGDELTWRWEEAEARVLGSELDVVCADQDFFLHLQQAAADVGLEFQIFHILGILVDLLLQLGKLYHVFHDRGPVILDLCLQQFYHLVVFFFDLIEGSCDIFFSSAA